ncbi:MAG TPA: FeoA family protein [Sorangium sp.]|uniref:FeoA family protein n=1 Tax=Sorangium sp. So ce1153 TaxID=3133333 RepID=UPI002CBA7B67|nr:FeoA family protein [Sorangium sp.]
MTSDVSSPKNPLLSSPLAPAGVAAPQREERAATTAGQLAALRAGDPALVVEVSLDADLAGWLEAMGIGPGQTLTVLRRAAFGGPIHVRAGSGGEFAIDAALARSILVAPVTSQGRRA